MRKPDFIIGDLENPYLLRWWVIPRNRFFNIYLHKFLRSDDDRALHDHPWASCSIILKGNYIEHTPKGVCLRKRFRPYFRRASQAHRIELVGDYKITSYWELANGLIALRPTWTLFITGPKIREWGFHCLRGWIHWREFTGVAEGEEAKGGEIGPGCGV